MEGKTKNFDKQKAIFKEIQALKSPKKIMENDNIIKILLKITVNAEEEDIIDIINISFR